LRKKQHVLKGKNGMSKPASTNRLIPVALTGLAVILCGCVVLGTACFFLNYQLPASLEPSLPQAQPPMLTQAPELPQVQPPAFTQAPQPDQPQDQVQYIPQYSDFLGKNQYDPDLLNISQIYCGYGQMSWNCPELGLTFSDSQGDNIVDVVVLYPAGYANFKEYKGAMPNGLTWSDTRADVENKIGLPNQIIFTGAEYTNLGNFALSISYNTDSWSDPPPSATIESIKIFLP